MHKYKQHEVSMISVPNMKFLCLNLWLGEVCTDDDDANADDNDNEGRRMTDKARLHKALWLLK